MNPQKIQFTPEMDGMICKAYLNYTQGSVTEVCKKLGIDHHVIRDRADELGLPKIQRYVRKKRLWSTAEKELLLKNEVLTARQVAHIFAIHGFNRSEDSIDNYRRKHMDWLMSTHMDEFVYGYSTFQIKDMLGVDGKTVHYWIKNGFMTATALPCGNRRVKRRELLRFMLNHPLRWKCANLDSVWLADLIHENMRMVETE